MLVKNDSIRNGWIFGADRKDIWIFGYPVLLGLLIIVYLSRSIEPIDPYTVTNSVQLLKPGIFFLIFSVFFDFPHILSSFLRIVLDQEDFQRRKKLFIGIPLLCFFSVGVLATVSKQWAIMGITYVNMFHRMKQDLGWVMYSRRMAQESDRVSYYLDRSLVYLLTLFPLIYLHMLPEDSGWWLFPGDLAFRLSGDYINLLKFFFWGAIAGYFVIFLLRIKKGSLINLNKIYLMTLICIAWYVGIVHFNGATWMIDLLHAFPYLMLIFYFGKNKWQGAQGLRGRLFVGPSAVLLYLGLVALAYLYSRPQAYLTIPKLPFQGWIFAAMVLPSVTHYVLDGFLWKVGKSNPDLHLTMRFPPCQN